MTSTPLVKKEIKRFLRDSTPEVICISGEWGIGKTFTWQTMLEHALQNNEFGMERHSYVSLFGINSLESLKTGIAENSLFSKSTEPKNLFEKAKRRVSALQSKLQPNKHIVRGLPTVKDFLEAFDQFMFATVRNQVICIDDFERRGKDLSVKDTLGLVSFLREQRECKVVLLLNKDELGDDFQEFDDHSEKVIDVNLKFNPEPSEAVEIALSNPTHIDSLIGENCTKLGISNIRVIKKTQRYANIIYPTIESFHENIANQAANSLTLFTWSKFQRTLAPSIEFLKKRGSSFARLDTNAEERPPQEVEWDSLLDAYGFMILDDLDKALLDGVENGYFDHDKVKEFATKLDDQITKETKSDNFSKAWDLYYSSFDDNAEEIIASIYDAFTENVDVITSANLNNSVCLFKDLGEDKKAQELITLYISERKEGQEFWDIRSHHHFPGDVIDQDIVDAFKEKKFSFESTFDPTNTLLRISESDGWNQEDIFNLANLSPDDYYDLFKSNTGDALRAILRTLIRLKQIVNPDEGITTIIDCSTEALQRIGNESPVNARRVGKLGIRLKPPNGHAEE